MKMETKSLVELFVARVKGMWSDIDFKSWLLYCVAIPLAGPLLAALVALLYGYLINDCSSNDCLLTLENAASSGCQSGATNAKPISLNPYCILTDLFVINGVFVFFGADLITGLRKLPLFRKKRENEYKTSEKKLTHIDKAKKNAVGVTIQEGFHWTLGLFIFLVYLISIILFLSNFLLIYKPFVDLIENCKLLKSIFAAKEGMLVVHLSTLFVAFCAACRIWIIRIDRIDGRESYVN